MESLAPSLHATTKPPPLSAAIAGSPVLQSTGPSRLTGSPCGCSVAWAVAAAASVTKTRTAARRAIAFMTTPRYGAPRAMPFTIARSCPRGVDRPKLAAKGPRRHAVGGEQGYRRTQQAVICSFAEVTDVSSCTKKLNLLPASIPGVSGIVLVKVAPAGNGKVESSAPLPCAVPFFQMLQESLRHRRGRRAGRSDL